MQLRKSKELQSRSLEKFGRNAGSHRERLGHFSKLDSVGTGHKLFKLLEVNRVVLGLEIPRQVKRLAKHNVLLNKNVARVINLNLHAHPDALPLE